MYKHLLTIAQYLADYAFIAVNWLDDTLALGSKSYPRYIAGLLCILSNRINDKRNPTFINTGTW